MMFLNKLVKNSISTKAKVSSLFKNPESLSRLEVGLDQAPYIQFLCRYGNKLAIMKPKTIFTVLPLFFLSTKGLILPCDFQGKYTIINESKRG